MKKIPRVSFSEWVQWSERTKLARIDESGVYVLARFKKPPMGKVNPLSKEIVYIGETCDTSLRGRWNQFNRSAFEGKFGHSGGTTYRSTFGDKGTKLFVAGLPVGQRTDALGSVFIRYVERKLLLDFALKWGSAPICNRK